MASPNGPDYNRLLKINNCYQESMKVISKAVKFDEDGNKATATQWYLKGLEIVKEGVGVDISDASYSGQEWNDARSQQEKMLKAQTQTRERLYSLQQRPVEQNMNQEPSYVRETTAALPVYTQTVPKGHTSLSTSLCFDQDETTELLIVPSGVQIFFVSEDLKVGTAPPSYPTFLKVLVHNSSERVFLQVSDWNYPLTPGQTLVLKTNTGVYLFPNQTTNTITQGSVGVVISTEVNELLIETFENILETLTEFRRQPKEDELDADDEVGPQRVDELVKVSTSSKIAAGIEKGAEWIGLGLSKGADYTTNLVNHGSSKLKERIVPNERPTEISPNVQKGLYYAHEGSKAAVRVSKFLVNGLCAITTKVGEELAPHIKDYSEKILPRSATTTNGGDETVVDGTVKVIGASLSGFATVWTELEKSGLAIAEAVSSATVENVDLKYGKDAGIAANQAMGAFVNVGRTAFNLDNLGMKAIAKRAAKDTSKAVLTEYAKKGVKDAAGTAV